VSEAIDELLRGWPGRRGQVASRAAMARLLWAPDGSRRIPTAPAFDRAAAALAKGELWRMCELNPIAPIYLIPTRPFLRALARRIRACGARTVLEIAAGDGHLARSLRAVAPDLRVTATDSGSWERPAARMSARDRRELRGTAVAGLAPGPDVLRLPALRAIRELRPQLVLCSWLPPGPMLAQVVRAAPQVLEIGAGSGITGDIRAWRYDHEFCDELDALGRCRLDERPREKLHTRVTLYRG
jgi:hypothetical protein